MSTVHFTSDLHLGHAKVAELRGFSSVEEHDETILDRWRACVGPRDKVFVLGDVTGSSVYLGRAMALLKDLPGVKHLIAGNHDACHPMNPRAHRATTVYYSQAFESVQSAGVVKIAGHRALLSHFPYSRDRGETRYAQWRLPNLGEWLLHGHTHGTERRVFTEGFTARSWDGDVVRVVEPSREIHVGLDAWGLAPVSLAEVSALVAEVDGCVA